MDPLEQYLTTTFSKIKDQYGQNLNISPALPTLVQVLKGTEDPVKKYDFIGESVCEFCIRLILANHYSNLENSVLDLLSKKFRAFQQLNKALIKEINLKSQMRDVKATSKTLQSIAGVLYSFFGTTAVEKFIEMTVLMIVEDQLNEAKSFAKEEGPLQKYNHFILSNHGGSIQSTPKQLNGGQLPQWEVTVTTKMTPNAAPFSHTRIAQSIRKAKTAAYQDILNYFDTHPNDVEQLKLPSQTTNVFVLPIQEADHSVIECHIDVSPPSGTSYSPIEDENNNNFHISLNDDDAVRKLSALLLGNSMDDDAHTRKRMRDDQKTGVDNMFSPTTVKSDDPILKTEPPTFNAFSLFSSAAPTTPTMTTTKEEQEVKPTIENVTQTQPPFNPFNSTDSEAKEVNPRIIHYFKNIFKHHRCPMLNAISMPGQSKSTLLSLVLLNGDKMECNGETLSVGLPHSPVFSAKVRLQSKEYKNVFIVTEGVATRKKDAECSAYHKLVLYFK